MTFDFWTQLHKHTDHQRTKIINCTSQCVDFKDKKWKSQKREDAKSRHSFWRTSRFIWCSEKQRQGNYLKRRATLPRRISYCLLSCCLLALLKAQNAPSRSQITYSLQKKPTTEAACTAAAMGNFLLPPDMSARASGNFHTATVKSTKHCLVFNNPRNYCHVPSETMRRKRAHLGDTVCWKHGKAMFLYYTHLAWSSCQAGLSLAVRRLSHNTARSGGQGDATGLMQCRGHQLSKLRYSTAL